LRFIATSEHVLQRVFNGRLVNPVYDDALETLVELLPGLPEKSAALLPPLATKLLLDDHDGLGLTTALALAGRLPASVRNAWDEALAKLPRAKAPQKNPFWIDRSGDAAIAVRMALADVDGNLDRWVTLAASLSPNARSPLAIARRLHEAGRHAEALKWVREKSPRSLVRHLRRTDFGFVVVGDEMHEDRIMLEADILWAIGEREAAQQTRWDWFEKSLQVEPLRAYIAALDDFAEFEETDRAFAVVDTSKDIFSALSFYLLWPRNDPAAALVLRNRAAWSGQHYDLLSAAADILEEAHAAAAVVLYRALLNDILNNGKSQAYGHAARYWLRLVDLSAAADPALGIDNHAAYGAELRKKHGRKHGFVYAVKQQGGSF
ncbi:MAG: hypothetical protein KDA41_14135, partial [Planctomycetales bacterium]|nr:hypothetical protein [Planctomycetales bacterium]